MIRVNNLTKVFRVHKKEPGLKGSIKALFRRQWLDKVAVKNVSLRVEPGEIVGLVGANGAGKTTLVKALAGIIHPTSGTADILGHVPWERKPALQRQISLIMGQKAQLWWDLPAADCFILLREIYQVPPRDFAQRLDFLAETLQVKPLLNIQIRRLSLGERMKMELIAALLHQPRVVFLDEPTIGLDITAQRAIREFILEYREKHQPAMILTSHYMEDIERLCERIVILREGEVVYDDTMSRLMTDFATDKIITADFGGAHGRLERGNATFSAKLGTVVEHTPALVKIKVSREHVAEAAAMVLKTYPVADLSIDEPEIGAIIERIMRKGLST